MSYRVNSIVVDGFTLKPKNINDGNGICPYCYNTIDVSLKFNQKLFEIVEKWKCSHCGRSGGSSKINRKSSRQRLIASLTKKRDALDMQICKLKALESKEVEKDLQKWLKEIPAPRWSPSDKNCVSLKAID